MKFAHLGDCHLGGWRQPELQELNMRSFHEAMTRCMKEKVEFILIAGDLFDTAYPPIETLKSAFEEFRRVREAKIPVFLIAGSHDYSVSGKTFLEVLERAGFCKNVFSYTERDGKILLEPTIHENVAIYGYPGKKSGLEVDDVERIKLQDAPGLFKILMLHTTLRDAIGDIPMKAVDETKLPRVDYTALAHLHVNYNKDRRVYSGPTFPNNISELEELGGGTFYIYDNGNIQKQYIKIAEVATFRLELKNALKATDDITEMISKESIKDKIVILRLFGLLENGKVSDIDFQKIENFVRGQGAIVFLKSTTKLHMPETEIESDVVNAESVETDLIKRFEEKNVSRFNSLIPGLMRALHAEKNEDETTSAFEDRLLSESKKVIQNEISKD